MCMVWNKTNLPAFFYLIICLQKLKWSNAFWEFQDRIEIPPLCIWTFTHCNAENQWMLPELKGQCEWGYSFTHSLDSWVHRWEKSFRLAVLLSESVHKKRNRHRKFIEPVAVVLHDFTYLGFTWWKPLNSTVRKHSERMQSKNIEYILKQIL